MEDDNVGIMDKKLNDLNVRDAIKINLYASALCVGVVVVPVVALAAKDFVSTKIQNRRIQRDIENTLKDR